MKIFILLAAIGAVLALNAGYNLGDAVATRKAAERTAAHAAAREDDARKALKLAYTCGYADGIGEIQKIDEGTLRTREEAHDYSRRAVEAFLASSNCVVVP